MAHLLPSPKPRAAFTLIELLATVAIVVLLVSLLFPALGKMTAYANDAKCVSNLRQMALGITLYAGEHDNYLPGPTGGGVAVYYDGDTSRLLSYLQPYLGLPQPTSNKTYVALTHCPALSSATIPAGSQWTDLTIQACYSNNDFPSNQQYLTATPFGGKSGSSTTPPLKMSQLQGAIDTTKVALDPITKVSLNRPPYLSMIPAIREICTGCDQKASWPWPTPTRPQHGNHRNALFLDWHVGRISAL